MDISLAPEFEQLVDEKVRSGMYRSPSEVIQKALQLLKEHDLRQARLDELRREVAVGLAEADRGELAPIDVEAIKSEGRRRLAEEQEAQ